MKSQIQMLQRILLLLMISIAHIMKLYSPLPGRRNRNGLLLSPAVQFYKSSEIIYLQRRSLIVAKTMQKLKKTLREGSCQRKI